MKVLRKLCILLLAALLLSACQNGKPTAEQTAATDATSISETTAEPEVSKPTEPTLPTSNELQFSPNQEGIYNYCPTAMQLDDGSVYIYYCTNQDPYQVIDYVGCRRGVRGEDGSIVWESETVALSPDGGTWDAHHTCDPSVIAGEFTYQGQSYGYLMAYLGCTSYDNQENKIGLAVSKTPEGPFVRVGNTPLIDFQIDPSVSVFQWGVGQPSLVSLDKKGHVNLFYTQGDKNGTRLMVDEWELSNLDTPQKIKTESVSKTGLFNLQNQSDFMNNADLLYDANADRYYAISDCHPNPTDVPDYIASHVRINFCSAKTSIASGFWRSLCSIAPAETGFARNHNAGFLRDAYGHLPDNGYLTAFYTVSVTGNDSLWSYRIYDHHVKLP